MDPLLIVILVLLVLWLGGFAYGVGSLIHVLLLVVLVVVIVRILRSV